MGASVVAAAEVGTLALALFAVVRFALAVARFAGLGFVFGGEAAFFVAADAAVGVEPFEDELGGGRAYGLVFGEAERPGLLHQALNGIQLADHGGGIDGLIELERAAEIEPFDHRRKINALEVLVEDLADGAADEIAGDGIAAFQLALVFQFQFAGDGGEGGVDVGDARDGGIVPAAEGAALGVRDHVFEDGDGEALADAGALVDALVLAGEEGQLFDHAADVIRHADLDGRGAAEPGFLLGDGDALFEDNGVVGADLAADAVLEGGNDLAAGGVVFGVGGEDEEQVEREADGVALNLDVAFLHDVEEPDLDFAGEIGEFVDGENAAVGARQETVVDSELVGDVLAAAGGLDGVDIADHVGNGDVRSGQLFDVAMVAVEPGDGRIARFRGHQIAAAAADGRVRVIVNFAAGEVRSPLVEQAGELAEETGFGLPAQSEEDEVVARQDGVDHLRHHGILVSDDAGKERFAALNSGDQVLAEFVFDAAAGQLGFGKGTGAKRSEGTG